MGLLRRLLNDQIRTVQRTNVVQARKFSEQLDEAINRYTNRSLTTAEIIAELVKLAKEMRDQTNRHEQLGLSRRRGRLLRRHRPERRRGPADGRRHAQEDRRRPGRRPSGRAPPSTGTSRSRCAPRCAPRFAACSPSTTTRPTSRRRPSSWCWSRPSCSRRSGRDWSDICPGGSPRAHTRGFGSVAEAGSRSIHTERDRSGDRRSAITDHNRVDFVRSALEAAKGAPLLLLPGIEISTHDGHLLALFAPDSVDALEALAASGNLKLTTLSDTEKRSTRSMLDLVQEIYDRGGLAIPAHVDVKNGAGSRLSGAQWCELLCSPALAGVEFAKSEALNSWFTDDDSDDGRKAALKARQKIGDLRERGLARLMSSDAHGPDQVGRDRASRTLTRLRLDDLNFNAVRNAISLNPKARCKAEVILPATYPRIISAEFTGGFLDGVTLDFSANLNCLIGGRGSGKSTALLAIRTALGGRLASDEDPDDEDRMPSKTIIRFVDAAGSERTAIRDRGEAPKDTADAPIRLRLADLGQEETGRLARGYNDDPNLLLEFLDAFIVQHKYDEREAELITRLEDNGAEVLRTSGIRSQIAKNEAEEARLTASLKAATEGRVDEIAKWATTLASQGPLLEVLETRVGAASTLPKVDADLDLVAIAADFGVDLATKPAVDHVEGTGGLKSSLHTFEKRRAEIIAQANRDLAAAAADVRKGLDGWRAAHTDLDRRLRKRVAELEAQGLKVQAGAIAEIGRRLNDVKTTLTARRKGLSEHQDARSKRTTLVEDLHRNRENLFLERQAVLTRIAADATAYADDLTIRVAYEQHGIDGEWVTWLSDQFGFRKPRVSRLAAQITPLQFSQQLISAAGRSKLLALKDTDGAPFFTDDQLAKSWKWRDVFALETMSLPDRARIEVQRRGENDRHQFDHLSAGQQRSVLLGLVLCAERNEPLVLDQPEDHLDGQYIATSVVRHLEAAKERRQVIIATHSANLTVLGDAELVVPMVVEAGRGRPDEPGAVDRPATRGRVCTLLEGGVEAYKKRGRRYGLSFAGKDA